MSDFVIRDTVLEKYTGRDAHVVIPEGVDTIGNNAFAFCDTLQSLEIPEGVRIVGNCAFLQCFKLKHIQFPDSLNQVDNGAFYGCSGLEEVVFANRTVEIGSGAFYGCSNLKRITMSVSTLKVSAAKNLIFGESGKTIELLLLQDNTDSVLVIGSFRKAYWTQTWAYEEEYLVPIADETLPNYDRLVAVGDFEGFKMNEQGRLKAMVWRLQEKERPVNPEYREMFAEFLSGKFSKLVKMAEEEQNASYIRTVLEMGIVNDANKKKITNALNKSAMDEIRQFADHLDEIVVGQMAQTEEEVEGNVDKKYLIQLRKINAKTVLLKAGLEKLPEVLMADKKENAPMEYIQLILAEYLSQYKKDTYVFAPLADEVAALLDKESLANALVTLYENATPESIQQTFLPVVFRYANGALIEKIWHTYKGKKWMEYILEKCLLLSDTRNAMLLADKQKILPKYALMRGTTEEDLQDTMLYDFGFDETGRKTYDLGGKNLEISLNNDLTLGIFDVEKGKTVKSIPKKDVDPELYAFAYADYSETKKNIKKAANNKSNRLFEEFLDGKEHSASKWQELYLGNPVLRQIANLLVWNQQGKTFVLSGTEAVDAGGKPYTLSDAPVSLTHPKDMRPAEVAVWQKYFTSHGLKQPFEQVWEPVVAAKTVNKDRYAGCMIPYYRFIKQEKHGIHVRDEDFHNEITIWMDDCNVNVERIDWERHAIDINHRFEIKEFAFKKYTRQVNHLVTYFDRITVYDRIRNDDVSVAEILPRFTLAQITEFINVAVENNCTNVSAILLDYKNRTFSDFDPMDAFSLEW